MKQAPLSGDEDRAPTLNAVSWTLAVLSLGVCSARVFSRLRLTRNIWWDDWFVLITLVRSIFTGIHICDSQGALGADLRIYHNANCLRPQRWMPTRLLPIRSISGARAESELDITGLHRSSNCDWQSICGLLDLATWASR